MPGFKEATREWFRSLNVNIHTSLLYLTIFAQLLTIGSTRCLMGNLRMCLVLTAHIKTPSLQQRWFSGLKKFWESVLNFPKTLSCSPVLGQVIEETHQFWLKLVGVDQPSIDPGALCTSTVSMNTSLRLADMTHLKK